jgi:putative transposase
MSRPLRIQYPNAWYHVMNRARRGQVAFPVKEDKLAFLYLLKETAGMFNLNVSAWCLMETHYHLLVQTPDANLARCMRNLNGVYTQKYNFRHGCDGTLFRGRYKSILVDSDNYLLELVRYIHRNPLRAGLVEKLSQYNWSSHKAYLSGSEKWNWVHKDFILGMLAKSRNTQLKKYRRFVSKKDSPELCSFFEKINPPSIIGDKSFVDWVKDTFFSGKIDHNIPQTKTLAPSINEIKNIVCEYYQIDEQEINLSRRGMENLPRDVAIYLMRSVSGEALLCIGEVMGIRNYSSVSSAVHRIKNKLPKDKRLEKDIQLMLDMIIKKSQTET